MKLLLIINMVNLLWLILADSRVLGLTGGYGLGTWAETYGGYLWSARRNKKNAWVCFLIITALNYTFIVNCGWS